MKTRTISLVSVFISLGVATRLFKHAIAGTLQFVNTPLAFAMIAGKLVGAPAGALTGFLAFLLSDLIIGLGPWTPINGMLAGLIGATWSLLKRNDNFSTLFAAAFLSTFAYDVLSSFVLYSLFIRNPWLALTYSVIGLFVPVMGGYLIGVGPITETITAGVTAVIAIRVKKILQAELKVA